MIHTIAFKDKVYPKLQSEGFAAQFAFPFANKLLFGDGYDIGCNRFDWMLPTKFMLRNVMPIEPLIDDEFDAYNLPQPEVDFIFSSHCLEHLKDWVDALDYWQTKLKSGGILFLYLPHPSQEYWLPFNNRKHIHSLSPEIIGKYFDSRKLKNTFVTGADLNCSFYAIAEKI